MKTIVSFLLGCATTYIGLDKILALAVNIADKIQHVIK
jgi:hypothetical protein